MRVSGVSAARMLRRISRPSTPHWSISTGALTYDAALASGLGYTGASTIASGYPLGGAAALPPLTFGTGPGQVQGFTLTPNVVVPEPSTIALGLLGAAALFFRRRK